MTSLLEALCGLLEWLCGLPYGKIAVVLSLVLIIDHGIRHLEDRWHDWKGRWYCKLALIFLTLCLFCHAVQVGGEVL